MASLTILVAPQPSQAEPQRFIRPRSDLATLGSRQCFQCHEKQSQSWMGHAHYDSAKRLLDKPGHALKIARLYGISESEMLRGDQVCMDCHGTIVSGREDRSVLEGVGCESCHGPAEAWRDVHQEQDGNQGENRSGYKKALNRGMRKLRDLDVMTKNCTGCHWITDPGLRRATHVEGSATPLADGMAGIRHWERDPTPLAELTQAFERARNRTVFRRLEPIPVVVTSVRRERSSLSRRLRPPRPRPAAVEPAEIFEQTLPDFVLPDGIEERLIYLKSRLESLDQLRGSG